LYVTNVLDYVIYSLYSLYVNLLSIRIARRHRVDVTVKYNEKKNEKKLLVKKFQKYSHVS